MASYVDYLPGGKNHAGGIESEINDADTQETGRQEQTPIDWEKRYKELEKLNSRQAQTLGEQRRMIDEFIMNPTPAKPVVEEPSQPITVDDFYDNPDETLRKTAREEVSSHPAIKAAEKLVKEAEERNRRTAMERFETKHPDYKEIYQTPEFANWLQDDPTRMSLAVRANEFDLSAADALFSLYKAEQGLTTVQDQQRQRQAIEAASLEDSSALIVREPPQYSRSEYIQKLTRARQGDLEAEDWVKRNAPKYREALASGNVRD